MDYFKHQKTKEEQTIDDILNIAIMITMALFIGGAVFVLMALLTLK